MTLPQAAADGDEGRLREALDAGADIDATDSDGRTPLMAAVLNGHLSAVRLLIESGANLEVQDQNTHTALMHAASSRRTDIVEALLHAGADARAARSRALDFAVRFGTPEMVPLLLAHGADASRCDDDRLTPLLEAVNKRDQATVRVLLAAGARMDSDADRNPLAAATRHSDQEMLQLLLDAGCPLAGALRAAAESGHTEIVRLLLERGAPLEEQSKYGATALSRAASDGHARVVALLLCAGANREHRDGNKHTPLYLAASEGHEETVRLLLEYGASRNAEDESGATPLHQAVWHGHRHIVRLLLRAGADVNASSARNSPPLFWAISHRRTAIARLLLEAGAEVNVVLDADAGRGLLGRYPAGTTPLLMAARKGLLRTVERLLAAGARVDAVDSRGHSAVEVASRQGHEEILRRLAAAGAVVDFHNRSFLRSALFRAARQGDTEKVRALLAAGADPNDGPRGMTPLQIASLTGHVEVVRALLAAGAAVDRGPPRNIRPLQAAVVRGHTEVVHELLAAGADVRRHDSPASVPAGQANTIIPSTGHVLLDAAFLGHAALVGLLLRAGADVNAVREEGQTALGLAVQGRQFVIAKRLLEAGAVPRPEDADVLALLAFREKAGTPLFQQTVAELAVRMGTAPEPMDGLPGAVAFRITLPDARPEPAGPGEAAQLLLEQYSALDSRTMEVLREASALVRERGFQLIDAGRPLGCGAPTQVLLLVPSDDKYAVLAAVGVNGNEAELSTEAILHWLRELEKEEPFELRGCRFDTVEIEFAAPVGNPQGWAERMYAFCPDLVDQGFEKMERLVEHLKTQRRVRFWWD